MITLADPPPSAYSGMRSLSAVLEQPRVVRASRAASLSGTDHDCLYGIGNGQVVPFRITRWTPKRVYYVSERVRYSKPSVVEFLTSPGRCLAPGWAERDGNSVTWVIVSYADRAALERDGQVRTGGHPANPDHVLYASKDAAQAIAAGDVKALRRQIASVHPTAAAPPGSSSPRASYMSRRSWRIAGQADGRPSRRLARGRHPPVIWSATPTMR